MLADNVVKEGISNGVHIRALQWNQYHHLTKAVHDRNGAVVAAIFQQVRDEVNVDLLPVCGTGNGCYRPASLYVSDLLC